MANMTRRGALKWVAGGGAAALAPAALAAAATSPASAAEASRSCRLLPRSADAGARVFDGAGGPTLVVRGETPAGGLRVILAPLPGGETVNYRAVEVVACAGGPDADRYEEFLPLRGLCGSRGVEVIWAGGRSERIDVATGS